MKRPAAIVHVKPPHARSGCEREEYQLRAGRKGRGRLIACHVLPDSPTLADHQEARHGLTTVATVQGIADRFYLTNPAQTITDEEEANNRRRETLEAMSGPY